MTMPFPEHHRLIKIPVPGMGYDCEAVTVRQRLLLLVTMVIRMRNVPHRLKSFNTMSPGVMSLLRDCQLSAFPSNILTTNCWSFHIKHCQDLSVCKLIPNIIVLSSSIFGS